MNPDIWMQSLDYLKTVSKETRGHRNAMNLIDCKEIEQNSVRRS